MKRSRGRSRHYDVKVQFRLSRSVYRVLRVSVPNVSAFLRKLVYDALEKLPVCYEFEEFKLEVEISQLTEELGKVHRWQTMLLKHGSYAEAYLAKLKGGWVQDRKPYFVPEPPPFVRPDELLVVEDIVRYREKLAKQLVVKLNRIMTLKNASQVEEGSFAEYVEGKKRKSRSRDEHQPAGVTNKKED